MWGAVKIGLFPVAVNPSTISEADNLPAERLEELNRALDEYILRCLAMEKTQWTLEFSGVFKPWLGMSSSKISKAFVGMFHEVGRCMRNICFTYIIFKSIFKFVYT